MVEASLQAQDKASSSQQTQAVIRDRHLQMYRESKAKRIKKIKSKVYRALKKKQRTKEDQKRLELLADEDPELYRTEIERQEKDRAKERLSLRHRNKNKFTEQLKRYADQKDVQKIYGELNRERKKVLKKMNLEDWQELASSESDYAEAEFEAQAIKEIEKEFDSEEERVDEEESTDIVQQLMKRGRENMIKEARELVATLRGENPATADSPSAALAAEGRAKYIRKEQLLDDAK
jgi:U3 small nucleolar RNA-associated protein 14